MFWKPPYISATRVRPHEIPPQEGEAGFNAQIDHECGSTITGLMDQSRQALRADPFLALLSPKASIRPLRLHVLRSKARNKSGIKNMEMASLLDHYGANGAGKIHVSDNLSSRHEQVCHRSLFCHCWRPGVWTRNTRLYTLIQVEATYTWLCPISRVPP
ncbi:hypothetical protein Bbelb_123330 [Branchiostoma belcheri]|nr:hypothetical protein Bbelb_123330 [Branchiostoma belcheri]